MINFQEQANPPGLGGPELSSTVLDLVEELFRQNVRITYVAWNYILYRFSIIDRENASACWLRLKRQLPLEHQCVICRRDGSYLEKLDYQKKWMEYAPPHFEDWLILGREECMMPVLLWYSEYMKGIEVDWSRYEK